MLSIAMFGANTQCVAVRARFSRINMSFFTDFYVFLFNLVDTSGFEMC